MVTNIVLTLFIIMAFLMYVEDNILHFTGSKVEISKLSRFVFIFAKSADPDEMSHDSAFPSVSSLFA